MAVPPPSTTDIDDVASAKTELRSRLLATRLAFVARLGDTGLAEAQGAIARRLATLLDRDGPLAGYVAHRGEPSVLATLNEALRRGCRVALPHISADRRMTFADLSPDTMLSAGPLGIRQPAAPGAIVPTILLVPLLGFDRHGHRLGQGGGYYDRWLEAHPTALRIGVAWSVQEVDALRCDPWDMPLHAVVTEREWIDPLRSPS